MKLRILLCAATAILVPSVCWSSEEYDPLLYPDLAQEEAVPLSEPRPYNESQTLALPKVMSDEDLNFENMDFDSLDAEPTPQDNSTEEVAQTPLPQTAPAASQTSQSQSATPPKVDKNKTLTDNLEAKSTSNEDSVVPVPKVEGTWLAKIKEPLLSESSSSEEPTAAAPNNEQGKVNLSSLMEKSKTTVKRSNASVFDISGVMLRMTLPQAESAMKARHFTKVSVKYEIPNFIKWRNEEKCRNRGVVGYERLASCVVELAKKDNHQYPETVKFSRFDTKEELEIKLTSNFTGNKIYRVLYKSMSPSITGNSNKAMYLRNVKIYDFWKKVNQKYGSPDNKDEVLWGLGGNKPYLKAASGVLLLEDPMLRELDYTRMSREDQRFINTDLYNF